MITYSNHAFFTLTWQRDCSYSTCWKKTTLDFNRFIQKIRRLHNSSIQYVRAIEAHEDKYPHIHAILQFPNSLTITNGRYFDKTLFKKWKQCWTGGLSDIKPTKPKQTAILYLMKYILKNSTTRSTLWKKMIVQSPTAQALVKYSSNSPTTPTDSSVNTIKEDGTIQESSPKEIITTQMCQEYKIKQLSWSRSFSFPILQFKNDHIEILRQPKIALINAPIVTQKSL